MKRELDEIELELKGVESMEYKCGFWPSTFGAGVLCGRVILCPMIPRSTCPHRGPIPVEPERVKWYYRMSCATRSCAANDEGMCNVSINGLATCSKHQWPKPSPGLLQRMGMATWPSEARDWFCISQFWPSAHSMTETEAKEMCRGESLRAFRWSQGVQG